MQIFQIIFSWLCCRRCEKKTKYEREKLQLLERSRPNWIHLEFIQIYAHPRHTRME